MLRLAPMRSAGPVPHRIRTRTEVRRAAAIATSRLRPSRLALLRQVRGALARRELTLHFQPKAELATGRIIGCEALLRWQHPKAGLLAPGAFLPALAGTEAMAPISRYVIDEAVRTQRAWEAEGVITAVQVNLGARDLADAGLADHLREIADAGRIGHGGLGVEVTEDDILEDIARACAAVEMLTALGVGVALDDFGTGYSSMARLRELPIGEIKIDRSFVGPMLIDADCRAIVRATVGLAHDLGKTVVAEGVEDEATRDELATTGCDVLQGYWLARPMPADAALAWLRAREAL